MILHTTHTYAPAADGVSEVVQQISTRLARRGHDMHVATSALVGSPREEVRDGVTVHRFAVRGNRVEGIRGDTGAYVEFVRSKPWDVIAMHCAQAWPLDALLPHVAELPGRKVFVAHGLSRLSDPHYASYFEYLAEQTRLFDAFVGLSSLTPENDFARTYGLAAPQVIPNGVDISKFAQAGPDLRTAWKIGTRPWLLSVGNHSPVKGHSRLFELVERLRCDFPDVAATIIGSSYPADKWGLGRFGVAGGCWYRCRLQSRLHRSVELKLRVPRQRVLAAFHQADITVITSVIEASPLVVLESMAAGTPWVSFDVGCVREHVGGIVVTSLEEMARAVSDLVRDPGRRIELGQQGRARIAARHDWERIVDQYEQLYLREESAVRFLRTDG